MCTYQYLSGACCGCRKWVRDLPTHYPVCAALDDAFGPVEGVAVPLDLSTGCAVDGCHRKRHPRRAHCTQHFRERVNAFRRDSYAPTVTVHHLTCGCGQPFTAQSINRKFCDECMRQRINTRVRDRYRASLGRPVRPQRTSIHDQR